MKIALLCLLLFYSTASIGQKDLAWLDGVLVLTSSEVLTGRLTIEPLLGVVLFESCTGKREVYSAHQIKSVYYHDAGLNINRRFVSLKESSVDYFHTFYEIVLQGEISVLRRQIMRSKYLSDAADYNYFVWFQEEVSPLRRFKRMVYPKLEQKQSSMAAYKSRKGLHPGNMVDAIRLIEHYNELNRSAEALARY